jgi:hypothetical protein
MTSVNDWHLGERLQRVSKCPHSSGQVARFPAGEHAPPCTDEIHHGGIGELAAPARSPVCGCVSDRFDAMLFDIDDAGIPGLIAVPTHFA